MRRVICTFLYIEFIKWFPVVFPSRKFQLLKIKICRQHPLCFHLSIWPAFYAKLSANSGHFFRQELKRNGAYRTINHFFSAVEQTLSFFAASTRGNPNNDLILARSKDISRLFLSPILSVVLPRTLRKMVSRWSWLQFETMVVLGESLKTEV
jgi:hypothetical protein